MQIETLQVDQALIDLLQSCALQVSDIDNNSIDFFGIYSENTLQAMVGYETLHGCGLLRSLAVAEPLRGMGYAQKLVAHTEQVAKRRGLNTLYLLTETAEHFFEKNGYRQIDRTTAPEAIKRTRQYSSLCPDSCALLTKNL